MPASVPGQVKILPLLRVHIVAGESPISSPIHTWSLTFLTNNSCDTLKTMRLWMFGKSLWRRITPAWAWQNCHWVFIHMVEQCSHQIRHWGFPCICDNLHILVDSSPNSLISNPLCYSPLFPFPSPSLPSPSLCACPYPDIYNYIWIDRGIHRHKYS